MADIYYPENLPLLQRNKSRNDSQTFINADVAAGAPFAQVITEDQVTTWPWTLKLTKGQAVTFQAWLRAGDADSPINAAWFNMLVRVELGLELQEVRFVNAPQITSMEGGFITYSGEVITRDLLNLGFDDYELVAGVGDSICSGDYFEASNLLDIIVNQEIPEP